LAFDVRIEAEGAVVGAASLALDPDAIPDILVVLRKDGREVGEIHGQGIQERRGMFLSFMDPPALAINIPLVLKRLALEHFQNRVLAFTEDADGAVRDLLNQLVRKGGEGATSDHQLRLRALLANEPRVGEVDADIAVIAVELFQSLEGGDHPFERITGEIEIEGVLQ